MKRQKDIEMLTQTESAMSDLVFSLAYYSEVKSPEYGGYSEVTARQAIDKALSLDDIPKEYDPAIGKLVSLLSLYVEREAVTLDPVTREISRVAIWEACELLHGRKL